MATPGTITSANAVYTIVVAGLFDTPQTLQQWSEGDMFTMGRVSNKELQLGADAALAAGWIPVLKVHDLMFLASSDSVALFELWAATEEQQRTALVASGLLTIPSTATEYTMSNGFLSAYSVMPDGKKVLQPRGFSITWGTVTPAILV